MSQANAPDVSIGTALSRAWQRMVLVGFKPFDIGKWLSLGFAMFLATFWDSFSQIGQQGVQFVFQSNLPTSPNSYGSFAAYLQANAQALAIAGGVGAFLYLVLYAVITFFACRGKFMMIQGLAENEAKIVDPWNRWAEQANSVFRFKVLTLLAVLILALATLGISAWIVWPDIQNGVPGDRSVWTASIAIPWLVVLGITWWQAQVITHDFIVPMMYAEPMDAWSAWSAWFDAFLVGHVWALTLFYLMRFVLMVAVASVSGFVMCATLCIAALPYLSSVVFMPLIALDRCFCYYFVEQFGPQWAIFKDDAAFPTCRRCGYDLRGNPAATTCPECGAAVGDQILPDTSGF